MTDTIQEHVPTVVAVAEPVDPTIPTNVYDHFLSVYDNHSPPAAERGLMMLADDGSHDFDCALPMAEERNMVNVDDVEAQKAATAAASSTPSGYNDDAGKSIGIVMFICIMVGLVSGISVTLLSFYIIGYNVAIACSFVAILLASSISCGCRCGSNLNIHPKVKRWSTATLICLVIQVILTLASMGSIYLAFALAATADDTALFVAELLWIIAQILYILAAVFAGMFTWGRKCCGGV